jgi:hypothetical protein
MQHFSRKKCREEVTWDMLVVNGRLYENGLGNVDRIHQARDGV